MVSVRGNAWSGACARCKAHLPGRKCLYWTGLIAAPGFTDKSEPSPTRRDRLPPRERQGRLQSFPRILPEHHKETRHHKIDLHPTGNLPKWHDLQRKNGTLSLVLSNFCESISFRWASLRCKVPIYIQFSFPSSQNKERELLELVQSDVCGPMTKPSLRRASPTDHGASRTPTKSGLISTNNDFQLKVEGSESKVQESKSCS